MSKPICFIIMPITTPSSALNSYNNDIDHFKHVLECLFVPAIEQAGFDAIPPNAKGSDIIHGEIVKQIETADMVLCDMSSLNPNVFFELGVRTAVDKPVCLVKDDATSTAPFDTTIIHHHTYLAALSPWTLKREVDSLCQHLKSTLTNSSGRNSLWKYFSLATRAELTKPKDAVEDRLVILSDQIRSLFDQFERKNSLNDSLLNVNHGSVANPQRHALLYKELFSAASALGVAVVGMTTGGNSANLQVRRGTLIPEATPLLNEIGKKWGYDLTVREQP